MSEVSESDIIFPDKTLLIGGEDVAVHEFKYLEGLKVAAIAQPLLTGLLSLIQDEAAMGFSDLDRVISDNSHTWIELLAISVDRTPEWVAELSDADGTVLSMTFWEINGPFLLRRVAFAKRFGAIVLNQPPVAS